MSLEVKLRKNQYLLRSSAAGLLVFAVWDMIKAAMIIVMKHSDIIKILREEDDVFNEVPEAMSLTVLGVMVLFFILIVFLLRYYIYARAMKEARGIKPGIFYLVLTALFALSWFSSLAFGEQTDDLANLEGSRLVTVIVELSSLAISIELLIAAFRTKYLTRKLRMQTEEG